MRGTALRDTLDFVNFNEFKNQIEWAQFGKAFNDKVNTAFLSSRPARWPGRQGSDGDWRLSAAGGGQLPLVTPSN